MTSLFALAQSEHAVRLRMAERAANPPLIIPAGPDYGPYEVQIRPGRVWFVFFPRWPELDDLIGLDLEMPEGAKP